MADDDEPGILEKLAAFGQVEQDPPPAAERSIIEQIGDFAAKNAAPQAEPAPAAEGAPPPAAAEPADVDIVGQIGEFARQNSPAFVAQRELMERRDALMDPWRGGADDGEATPVDVEGLKDAAADGAHAAAERMYQAAYDDQGELTSPELFTIALNVQNAALQRDRDQDGLTDGDELMAQTNPVNPDTDGDEIPDGTEVHLYQSNPLSRDTDHDGRSDTEEAAEAGVMYDLDGSISSRTPTDLLTTPAGRTPAPVRAASPPATSPGPVTSPRDVDPTLPPAPATDDVTGATTVGAVEPTPAPDVGEGIVFEAGVDDLGSGAEDPWAATGAEDPWAVGAAAAEAEPVAEAAAEPASDFGAGDAAADAGGGFDDGAGDAIDEGF